MNKSDLEVAHSFGQGLCMIDLKIKLSLEPCPSMVGLKLHGKSK